MTRAFVALLRRLVLLRSLLPCRRPSDTFPCGSGNRLGEASFSPAASVRLGDEGDAFAQQRAPLSAVGGGDGDPFLEDLAGGGEGATDSLGDEFGDPFAWQLDDEAGAFEVDEGEELAGDADTAATHDGAFFESWVLELKRADEIPEELLVRERA